MKKIVLVLILCLFAAAAWAQEPAVFHHLYVGVNGGWAYNTLYTSNNDGYYSFTEHRAGHGFTVSVPVRWQFFSWLGLQVEPTFIQKNYSVHRTGYYSPIYNELTNSFVDFPILANLSVGIPRLPALRVFVNAGGWLGVWADSHTKGQTRLIDANFAGYVYPAKREPYYQYDEKVEFDSRRDNRFDGGLIIGGGFQYSLKACTFNVECRYNYSLTDLQKNYMYEMAPKMNDTLVVQAGVAFNSAIFDIFKRGGK
ncbi:hypothetical protein FACS189442_6220 [Spirochaetia bacterium]|nr:hypothetical protein FACS189442_6220 [Spirochaetia bacterium]